MDEDEFNFLVAVARWSTRQGDPAKKPGMERFGIERMSSLCGEVLSTLNGDDLKGHASQAWLSLVLQAAAETDDDNARS